MQPTGPYIPSAASVPGSSVPGSSNESVPQGLKTLGTTALVLAVLELVYTLYKFGSAALAVPMASFQKKMLSTTPGASPPTTKFFEEMHEQALSLAILDAGRQVLFAVASGVLIYVAVRLMRGAPGALALARKWTWGAFAVLVASIGFQAGVIYPRQMEYVKLMNEMVTASGPPGGFGSTVELFSVVSVIVNLVGGTLIMAIWPIVLRIWADQLQKKLNQQPSAQSSHTTP